MTSVGKWRPRNSAGRLSRIRFTCQANPIRFATQPKRRVPDLLTLSRETRARNRRMNRNRIKIDWKFTRKAARCKFVYNKKLFKRS
jgi:hypothetical protein